MYKIYKITTKGNKIPIIIFDTFDKVQKFVNFHVKNRPDVKLEIKFGNKKLKYFTF